MSNDKFKSTVSIKNKKITKSVTANNIYGGTIVYFICLFDIATHCKIEKIRIPKQSPVCQKLKKM
jgi:hypothetical protein